MRAFFYIILFFIVGVHSQCTFTPFKVLPEGCKVGNLSITVGEQRIVHGRICNLTIDPFPFDEIPQMKFSLLNLPRSLAPSYLLSVVDRTSETLLWIISNLTIQHNEDSFPVLRTDHSVNFKFYSEPISSDYHDIEFHVFEEYRNHSSSNYIHNHLLNASPFNLSRWINAQQYGGIKICGPLAGGNVLAHQSTEFPSREFLLNEAIQNYINQHDDDDSAEANAPVFLAQSEPDSDPTPTQKSDSGVTPAKAFGIVKTLGIISLIIIVLSAIVKCIIACVRKIRNRD